MTLFKDVFVVSGCGVGGGSLGYANTLYRPHRRLRLLPRPAVVGARGLGVRARAPLRDRRADARRHPLRGRGARRPLLREHRGRAGRRGHLLDHPRRRLLRRAGRDRRPTPTSAARARRAPAASAAAPAWSAAATTPRTRWSRTTSGSPSAPASRSSPSAPSPRSARSARPTAPTATRSRASAPARGSASSAAR